MPAGVMDGQQVRAGNVPAGYVVNEPKLIANPRGEGTYKMVGPQGQTVQVPFSNVRGAEDTHFQLVGDPSNSKSDAGRYQRDAAVLAPSLLHSVETAFGVSVPQLKAEMAERQEHPGRTLGKDLRDAAGGPAYGLGKGLLQLAQHSYVNARDAIKEYHGGNTNAAIVDAVEAVPIVGHGINVAVGQAPVNTGGYWRGYLNEVTSGPAMGTLLATSFQAAATLDLLQESVGIAKGIAGEGPSVGGSEVEDTNAAMTEGAGADGATAPIDAAAPVDVTPAIEGEGATTAVPPTAADFATEVASEGLADDGPEGGDSSAATSPVESGTTSEAGEATSAIPQVDVSPARAPVDAAADAPASPSTFEASFSQIMQALKDSELSQRAVGVLHDALQTIFQGDPNLRFAMPDGPMEISPGEFFTRSPKLWDELKGRLIDPRTQKPLRQEQGLESSLQRTDGGGLAKPPDAPAEGAPEAATPEGQTATESSLYSDADSGAGSADIPAAKTPDTPVQTAPEGQTAPEASPQDEGITTSVKKKTKKVAGGIATIGGRKPINSRYAGGMHPEGIRFSEQGFPDFGPRAIGEVQVEGLTGKYKKDAAKANQVLGIPSTPDGFTWHHVEDGRTMQLIPSDIHRKVKHTGGAAVIRNGGLDKK